MYTDDPVRDFMEHDYEVEHLLSTLPICDACCEPIQDEAYYQPEPDLKLCKRCWDEYVKMNIKKWIETE